MKKILSVALCAAMLLCAAVPVFGAETTGSVVEPGDATAEAVVTAVGCAFSVTVPSALPVSVNSMGDVFVANNAKIVNESAGAVEVKDVQFAPANGWAAVAFDKDFVGLAMNLKEIGFIINGVDTTDNGMTFDATGYPVISIDGELPLTYDANVAPQSNAITDQKVADVIFTVGWYGIDNGDAPVDPPVVLVEPEIGTKVTDEYYEYSYGQSWVPDEQNSFSWETPATTQTGWGVRLLDKGSWETGGIAPQSFQTTIQGFDVVNADFLYSSAVLSNGDFSVLDTSKVTSMFGMFEGASNFGESGTLDASGLDTSNVTNMAEMFAYIQCHSIIIGNYDTSNVTTMNSMFCGTYTETDINLSSFDMSGVANTQGMFENTYAPSGTARTQADADILNTLTGGAFTFTVAA